MGKQGPCCHCGITSTPLWRNGPPDKPVLCNACGSRWRTKGSLANYTPIHSRAFTPDFEYSKYSREESLPPSKRSKSWYTRVHNEGNPEDRYSFAAYQTSFEDDASNKSSSGSAISVSESCVQFESTDGNEISGPFRSSLCDIQIPSKKRTRFKRQSPSPIEKLRQDLVTILHEQDSSYLSEFSEEAVLLEGKDLSFDSEFGHGSFLLKHPVSSKEEESEASSHIIGNKVSGVVGRSSYCSGQSQHKESSFLGNDEMIQESRDTNKLKEVLVKQCVSTNRSLKVELPSGPLRSDVSSQTSANEQLLFNESSCSAKEEDSSLTSDVTGSRRLLLGKTSGTTTTFKTPRERSHVEMMTSGKRNVHYIQVPASGSKCQSASSQNFSSEINNTVDHVQVKLP